MSTNAEGTTPGPSKRPPRRYTLRTQLNLRPRNTGRIVTNPPSLETTNHTNIANPASQTPSEPPTTPPPDIKRGIFSQLYGWHPAGRIHDGTDNYEICAYMKQWASIERRMRHGPRREVPEDGPPVLVTIKRYRKGALYETPVKPGYNTVRGWPLPVKRPKIFDGCPKVSDGACIAVGDIFYDRKNAHRNTSRGSGSPMRGRSTVRGRPPVRRSERSPVRERSPIGGQQWGQVMRDRLVGIVKGVVCWPRKRSPE